MAITPLLRQRTFVPPKGLFAGYGLAADDDAQNWLAATAAVDGLGLAVWRDDPYQKFQQNEQGRYQEAFGEAIDICAVRDELLSCVPQDGFVLSEVRAQLTDQVIAAELQRCGGKKFDAAAGLKSEVAHMVEVAQERKCAAENAASSKSKAKVVYAKDKLTLSPKAGTLTDDDRARIEEKLNELRAQKELLRDLQGDLFRIELDGVERYVQIPLASIRYHDVQKITKNGIDVYEIITQTPVFAGGVWSMNEMRQEFSAASKWVEEHLGSSAQGITDRLMSLQQQAVKDLLAQAQAQVQREIAEGERELVMSKLACGQACPSSLGALSSYAPSVNSRAFPKLAAPSLMV